MYLTFPELELCDGPAVLFFDALFDDKEVSRRGDTDAEVEVRPRDELQVHADPPVAYTSYFGIGDGRSVVRHQGRDSLVTTTSSLLRSFPPGHCVLFLPVFFFFFLRENKACLCLVKTLCRDFPFSFCAERKCWGSEKRGREKVDLKYKSPLLNSVHLVWPAVPGGWTPKPCSIHFVLHLISIFIICNQ